ncbi:HET-domain-containing protein [Decorospora gaudefroyi]|uniref:HET-domain-containing protein n=1 Tax=Decorospora gaudefroyi TaxID=184978 RepID=A0A6A5K680_9PLEO|nr:HET-domain-containing protein [Decorospora gaudefroyi]
MRLLHMQEDGTFSLVDFLTDTPPYAILSHTWGADDQELTYRNIIDGTGHQKAGYAKLQFLQQQANTDNLHYFWIDTCCIEKTSSAELSEAINSMFRWYRRAIKCYVYLADVTHASYTRDSRALQNSRWFTRGWTLQELIAPTAVEFFSSDGIHLGSKDSLVRDIAAITGIPGPALQGRPLSWFTVDDRMAWAGGRQTKRPEDAAYALMGLFDVHMPLIYGEGRIKAMQRLHKEMEMDTLKTWAVSNWLYHFLRRQSPGRYSDLSITALDRKVRLWVKLYAVMFAIAGMVAFSLFYVRSPILRSSGSYGTMY